ncbi:hypothetical protein H4696_002575 [Amycolatopsis lexingtonensis]|uniref:NADPH-dependent FMN reductase-like domain-containing protein n=1 Tax=Amycolatopsis lexingtonensis TaxID=218822 RepID=A0ABR9HX19_9PSEU|nr:hypothetical protein [Amycolatopsis lexingtonensis]
MDHDVRPGVEADMGDGDAWPSIRAKVQAADILLVATPTWVGHMSSVAQRVLERLDAELSETDGEGRQGRRRRGGRQRRRRAQDHRRPLPDPQRHGVLDPGPGRRLQRPRRNARRRRLDQRHAGRNAVHLARLLEKSQYPAA